MRAIRTARNRLPPREMTAAEHEAHAKRQLERSIRNVLGAITSPRDLNAPGLSFAALGASLAVLAVNANRVEEARTVALRTFEAVLDGKLLVTVPRNAA